MMTRATLVTDGASDQVLMPILRWLVRSTTLATVEFRWADLGRLRNPPKDLRARLIQAIELYPCELLFVHRDAERQAPECRYQEIGDANATGLPHICVVPVRMSEAWLLHDEAAIRVAAGRPVGGSAIDLPGVSRLESLPDPKKTLHDALRTASGAKGRRAKQFNPAIAAYRVAELVRDWSPLRQLPAFQQLEADTKAAFSALGQRVGP